MKILLLCGALFSLGTPLLFSTAFAAPLPSLLGQQSAGDALMKKAAALEAAGKFDESGAAYMAAAKVYGHEGSGSINAYRKAGQMYEKSANRLVNSQFLKHPKPASVGKAGQPSMPAHQTAPTKVSGLRSQGAPSLETVERLVSALFLKKHFNGPVTSISFQSVSMIRGAHQGQEHLDGDRALASTVYTYNVKYTIRNDYPTQYEVYTEDENYAIFKFHGVWDRNGVAGGAGRGAIRTINK